MTATSLVAFTRNDPTSKRVYFESRHCHLGIH